MTDPNLERHRKERTVDVVDYFGDVVAVDFVAAVAVAVVIDDSVSSNEPLHYSPTLSVAVVAAESVAMWAV